MDSLWQQLVNATGCKPCCGKDTSLDGQEVVKATDHKPYLHEAEPDPDYLDRDPCEPTNAEVYGIENDELEEREEAEVEGGAVYKGQWKGQVRHGKGILVRPDGQRFEGYFEDGRAHGHGVFTAADGNTYDGQWVQDRAHGVGRYNHVDGSTYHGEWYHDEKCGKGTESWADGARYEGEFLHGSKHGHGCYQSTFLWSSLSILAHVHDCLLIGLPGPHGPWTASAFLRGRGQCNASAGRASQGSAFHRGVQPF